MKTLQRVRRTRPNSPIFWNWTCKNKPDRQHWTKFQKSQLSAKSLHPTAWESWPGGWQYNPVTWDAEPGDGLRLSEDGSTSTTCLGNQEPGDT